MGNGVLTHHDRIAVVAECINANHSGLILRLSLGSSGFGAEAIGIEILVVFLMKEVFNAESLVHVFISYFLLIFSNPLTAKTFRFISLICRVIQLKHYAKVI